MKENLQAQALAAVAAALAAADSLRTGRLADEAEQIALSIPDNSDKALALCALAETLANTSKSRASRLIADAEKLIDPDKWSSKGERSAIAVAFAQIGAIDHAEQIANTLSSTIDKNKALAAVARTAALAGQADRAEHIARNLSEHEPPDITQDAADLAETLCAVATGLADDDPLRATTLAEEAEQVARGIPDAWSWQRSMNLYTVAVTLARAGQVDRAERIAYDMPDPKEKAVTLCAIAEGGSEKGRTAG